MQHHFWSQAAEVYEKEFIDPFRPELNNPVLRALARIPGSLRGSVADLGCGIGPLLPTLSGQFQQVFAVDFAAGMLERARQRCAGRTNITYLQRGFTDLGPLSVDVAIAINSLVLPSMEDLEKGLREIRRCLKPGGRFLGIVPSMDGVHYYTMLLVDRALAQGKPMDVARKNAAHHADHVYFDFAFGQFRYRGLEQHFWQPFEIRHRLQNAGFVLKQLKKVSLSWKEFACGQELEKHPPPWDWYFHAQ